MLYKEAKFSVKIVNKPRTVRTVGAGKSHNRHVYQATAVLDGQWTVQLGFISTDKTRAQALAMAKRRLPWIVNPV